MGEISGIDLIKKIKQEKIDLICIVVTGYATIDSAVEAMKLGAYEYIVKPFDIENLRKKIKEVENEIKLRKTFMTKSISVEPSIKESDKDFNINLFSEPFLVISNEDPATISEKFKIKQAISIKIGYNNDVNEISPLKFNVLRENINNFVQDHTEGTILFKGIEDLLLTHKWVYLKGFLENIREEILTSSFSMIILIDQNHPKGVLYQTLLHDALSLISIQAFDDIVSIISHSMRKEIITLLKMNTEMNFNRIGEELNIKSSSNLAFHIKRLVEEQILDKNDNLYTLSPRGKYFGEIIYNLENIGFGDPSSRIRIIKYE
jgi:YesN/AraC family two-component response regulator